jgi:transcriptional regulator with XRE-family HTH domain
MTAAGLSQAQLARSLKVTPAAVSLWLSGRTTRVMSENVFEIARVLHVDPEWLQHGTLQSRRARDMASQHPPPPLAPDALDTAIRRLSPETRRRSKAQ